jgi:hypothetical protein
MHARGNSHHGTNGVANGGTGIRKKRRHMRAILREGLEAALRADPQVLENCTPKTGYGRIVRGLVLEAGNAKTTPLKTLMSLIDWEPPAGGDTSSEEVLDDGPWDWNADGVWETMPEPRLSDDDEEDGKEETDEDDLYVDDRWPDGPRAELERRLRLLMTGNEADRARAQAIMADIRAEAAADEAAARAATARAAPA